MHAIKTVSAIKRRPEYLFLIVLAAVVLCLISIQPVFASSPKKVLILNSYHQGYKWTDDETEGIISVLRPQSNDRGIYIEYMGTKLAADDVYFKRLSRVFKQKYRKVRFDVIIATDDDAFNFLKRYRSDIFGMVPVVFCGVNWITDKTIKGLKLYTGVNEDADIPATLDLMLRLHPRTKGIYVIADTTTTGDIVRRKIQELVPVYRDRVAFYILPDMEMKDILNTVAGAPDDTLVLLTIFQQDKAGVFYEFSDSTRKISESSRVPVYGLWDFSLGFGIVGGMLTSGMAQGQSAGMLALRILKGESADSIPVIMKSPNRYMFDFAQLQRFGIDVSDLPKGSEVIDRPESFYKVNKGYVWGGVAGIVFMSAVVLFLVYIIKQRRKAEAALQEARNKLEVRVMERTAALADANQSLIAEIAERRKAQKRLQELSEVDYLTGLYNRRRLHELLKAEISKAKRHERDLSIIMLDLDHFKEINDKFGHDMGDLALVRTAEIMKDSVRQGDICARFGGEEFLIVAPETPLIGVVALAEKIRLAISEEMFERVGQITISAGATDFRPGDDEASMIKRADEALYSAKNSGRNLVKVKA